MNMLKFIREFFLRLFSFSSVSNSIRRTFHYWFRKRFLSKFGYLSVYEDQIIILGVFLMISSAFMFKKKKEKYFDFEWQSYLSIFKKEHIKGFILCSTRYLMDSGRIEISDQFKEQLIPELKDDFSQQYIHSVVNKTTKDFNYNINLGKYVELLELVLKINFVYCNEIPKDSSKVLDLVNYTTEWKQKMFELFDNKAEYIVFSFFVNLNK